MLKFTTTNKITLNQLPSDPLIHNLDGDSKKIEKPVLVIGMAIVILGIISGYLLSMPAKNSINSTSVSTSEEAKSVVGSSDTKTFRDSATGQIEAGGVDGEGTHKLLREGGESQTVFLTSSILDLSQFEYKKVRVWGETNAAAQAGWLMDVGKVEILE